jgi:hypothetical protein
MKIRVRAASQRCMARSEAFRRHLGKRSVARTIPQSTDAVSMIHATIPVDRERYQ